MLASIKAAASPLLLAALLGAAPAAAATSHVVAVGRNGNTFSPDSINAAVGDTIRFQFYNGRHSVVQGNTQKACVPGQNGFFSGYIDGNGNNPAGKSFEITVTTSVHTFFYSSNGNECQSGMVGVINPGGSGDLRAYRFAAGRATSASAPSQPNGGVYVSSGVAQMSQTTTTSTSSGQGSSATTTSNNNNDGGVVGGGSGSGSSTTSSSSSSTTSSSTTTRSTASSASGSAAASSDDGSSSGLAQQFGASGELVGVAGLFVAVLNYMLF